MSTIRKIAALSRRRDGQILVTLVIFLVALILVLGLVIDVGFAYVTRASLSKAVDAASLTGARNLSFGREKAETLARASFADNYPRGGRDVADPTVDVTFTTDDNHNTLINVAATTTINTFFIRILPQWKTLSVTSRGQAVRVRVAVELVLDRSGSMRANGGALALPQAVSAFIDNFDDTSDKAGLVSFASNASADLPIEQPFKSDVKNAVNNWFANSGGRTFMEGGLTLSKNAFQGLPINDGENLDRVVVFFTDGYANTFQDTFDCPSPLLMNLGTAHENPDPDDGLRSGYFSDPASATATYCYYGNLVVGGAHTGSCCPTNTTFTSRNGGQMDITSLNVWSEARARALDTAHRMRTDPERPVTIYVIGLGNVIDKDFLRQIANDPSAPDYDPNQPEGAAVFALTADQLRAVFQSIASKILLRLTR